MTATLTQPQNHSIRKAVPLRASHPVIAVKFINKDHAFRAGRLRPKQLQIELSLHLSVCPHDNIIRFLSHGSDAAWLWMCLELAEGGDLFDKIEADEGVGEDVAHFYFTQLCSAISWCHGKGVAHRDIKPENMLLSGEGDLKLADFGLATQFLEPKTGTRKSCLMVCGSPPYIAPEILDVGNANLKRKATGEEKVGYDPQGSDVWSCAIVLFVLLAGNTPWDQPVEKESWEYHSYVKANGRPTEDELWTKVPSEAMSLIRGMLKVEAKERFTMLDVRKHPWFTRRNPHLNAKGKATNPMSLATEMLENLRIDFAAAAPVRASQHPSSTSLDVDAMDIDKPLRRPNAGPFLSSTQPETPTADLTFDYEPPPRFTTTTEKTTLPPGLSASQPTTNHPPASTAHLDFLSQHLLEDPSMSQFHPTPSVPLTLTQQARQFNDILPSHSLARFLSTLHLTALIPLLVTALHQLSIPVATPDLSGSEQVVTLKIKTLDARRQLLWGSVIVEKVAVGGSNDSGRDVWEVRFVKAKGDPLGWRRLFKQVTVLCRDGVVVPL